MKFIHHSQEVNVADGVDIDVKVNIQFLPEVLFRFFSLKQLKIFKNNSSLKPKYHYPFPQWKMLNKDENSLKIFG